MKLREFIVKAKLNGYANKGDTDEREFSDGGRELIYEEGDFKYKDKYFGFNPFSGEEIVLKKGRVIWVMNYYGKTSKGKLFSKKIYSFLKKAMRKISLETPFRGTNNFKEGFFEYINNSVGDLNCFKGVEIISYKGKGIYRLFYHGGFVK